jgi:hypothetical protein
MARRMAHGRRMGGAGWAQRLAWTAIAACLLLSGAEAFSIGSAPALGQRGSILSASTGTARPPLRKSATSTVGPRMSGGAQDWLSSYKPAKEEFLDWGSPPEVSELPEMTRVLFEDMGLIQV